MTRVIAALALAGFSFVASAAEKPLPVTVTNPVLPVEVSNADPISVTVEKPEGTLVTCERIFVGSIGHVSGAVRVETGSFSSIFNVIDPVGSFSCSESLPEGMLLEELTVRFDHTQNVSYARTFLTLGDVGDNSPLALGVVSRESPRIVLVHPIRLTGPKSLVFKMDCGTPLAEQVTCGAGFTLLGRKL